MNDKDTQLELVRRYLDGTATAEETKALESLIVKDPGLRREFLRHANVDAALAGTRRPKIQASPRPKRKIWAHWRPLTGVAAGVVIGMFCTSLLLAYVGPLASKATTLLDESFETTSTPVVTGVALEPGVWRGDYAAIVGEEQGIKPEGGGKMLRMLRADYDGKIRSEGNHLADVYRLIDVRPYRNELADGRAVAQVSASFNGTSFPGDEKFGCAISMYALDAETAPNGPSHIGTALTADSLAMARSSRTKLDRDPDTWQRLTTELLVPSKTEFLVIRLHITQAFDSEGRPPFTGSYVDDVRMSLARSTPLP